MPLARVGDGAAYKFGAYRKNVDQDPDLARDAFARRDSKLRP